MGQMPLREVHTTTTTTYQKVSRIRWEEIMFKPINLYTIGRAWTLPY